MSFPSSIDSIPQPSSTSPTNNPGAAEVSTAQTNAIVAIETKVGTGASTPVASTLLRGTGTGTTAFAQANLTTDVTGTLPVANGGSGATTLTGIVKGNGTSAMTAVTAPSGTIVGTTDTQTLTNKTIAAASNTISGLTNSNLSGSAGITGANIANNTITPPQLTELGTWHVDISPYIPTSIVAGSWSIVVGSSTSVQQYISDGNQNDEIQYKVFLQAGTYSFSIVSDKDVNRGIYTVSIDGTSVGTSDAYSSTRVYVAVLTLTGITVATSAVHTLDIKMATKNASSSGYYGTLSLFTFIRTA